ncbi:hypothetical protein HETIRDRAFT_174245 [Heterobasidion irregulare TC 32-1]|uniref:Uncharacterized protein n=1 Tax=Heterobasidion irregulare (strain TC 32-1) TaxID=747525 RepID=W4JVK5_HETIT|nr:uncharacterized protein HETIRDRAFT_174245 [Heterobasidion irregulare TC 32-1]ETW77110.1 hypothetical protein HETIRDRAFT_174245 [Heterobasidion irregulare TC 32-1]
MTLELLLFILHHSHYHPFIIFTPDSSWHVFLSTLCPCQSPYLRGQTLSTALNYRRTDG